MVVLLQLLKEHGPLFKVSLPNEAQDLVFVADPDIIDQVGGATQLPNRTAAAATQLFNMVDHA